MGNQVPNRSLTSAEVPNVDLFSAIEGLPEVQPALPHHKPWHYPAEVWPQGIPFADSRLANDLREMLAICARIVVEPELPRVLSECLSRCRKETREKAEEYAAAHWEYILSETRKAQAAPLVQKFQGTIDDDLAVIGSRPTPAQKFAETVEYGRRLTRMIQQPELEGRALKDLGIEVFSTPNFEGVFE